MRAAVRIVLLALCVASAPAGCVLVSSTSRPGARDAGIDAPRVERDAQRPDAPGVDSGPLLSREEATRGLLAAYGANVVLPTYRAQASALAALEARAAGYAASGSEVDLEAAREAWRAAVQIVERAELLQVGPGGLAIDEELMTGVLGGQSLRNAIYFWPQANACVIDAATARGTYEDLEALAARPLYSRTLSSIEYLLFSEDPDHHCLPMSDPTVDDAVWAGLGPDGVRARRADHAAALATLARRAGDQLLAAWEPGAGDHAGALARAGEGGSPYPSAQEALNAIFQALFYVDTITKDLKVGVPAARNARCTESACPDALESRWAGRAREHLVANLESLREILLGGPVGTDAIGFDDLLRAVDAAPLADDLDRELVEAIDVVRSLPAIDPATLGVSLAELSLAYDAIRDVSNLLKTELTMVLGLSLPMGADGDND